MSDKKPIILIGVRQENRQCIAAVESMGRKVIGFVDRFYVGQTIENLPVLASELDLLDHNSKLFQDKDNYDWFVSTIFNGLANHKLDNENSWLLRNHRAEIANTAKLNLINIQHANSYVDPTTKLGRNIYIGWGTYIGGYCDIGDFNYFGYNCGIAHHAITGNLCTIIGPATFIGNTTIGDNVFMGPGTNISGSKKIKVTIGDNVIISPGSTIMRPIDNNCIYFSNGRTLPNKNFVLD
jgi:UDP-3-O-[3-hydroxymyristoyl] glucosamine N-acyltransferase